MEMIITDESEAQIFITFGQICAVIKSEFYVYKLQLPRWLGNSAASMIYCTVHMD